MKVTFVCVCYFPLWTSDLSGLCLPNKYEGI